MSNPNITPNPGKRRMTMRSRIAIGTLASAAILTPAGRHIVGDVLGGGVNSSPSKAPTEQPANPHTTDTTVIGQGEGAQDAAAYFLKEHGEDPAKHDLRQLGDEIAAENGGKQLKPGEIVQNPQELPNDK